MKTLRIVLCCVLCCAALPAMAQDSGPADPMVHVAVPKYQEFYDSFNTAFQAMAAGTQLEEVAGLVPMFAEFIPILSKLGDSRLDVVCTEEGDVAVAIAGIKEEDAGIEEDEQKQKYIEVMGMPLYCASAPQSLILSYETRIVKDMKDFFANWKPAGSPKGQIAIGCRMEEGALVSMLELDREELEKEVDDFLENPTTEGLPEGLTLDEAKELAQEFKKLLPDFMDELQKVTYMVFDLDFGKTGMTIATEVRAAKTDALAKFGELMSAKMLNAADIKNQTKIETADGKIIATVSCDYADLNAALKTVKIEESEDEEEEEEEKDAA